MHKYKMLDEISENSSNANVGKLVAAPDDAGLYRRLADNAAAIPDDGIRADLLTRWALIAGAGLPEMQTLIRSGAYARTRHYLAVMTAMRELKVSIAENIFHYERSIVKRPPTSREARRTALRHLLNRDDFVGPGGAILVAAMPKSASTFLCTTLARLIGGSMTAPHSGNDPVGVAFDQLYFVRAYAAGGVMHSHLDASARTLAMVRLLDLKPVVLTRNLFDALASYLDHSDGRNYAGSAFDSASEEQRRRIGILRMARHYVDMVASWSSAPDDIDVLWIDYAEVSSDPIAVVRRVLDHVGRDVDSDEIEAACTVDPSRLVPDEQYRLRFNKGIPGRGAMFTEEERSWVRALYAEYPHVDFSRIDPEIAAAG